MAGERRDKIRLPVEFSSRSIPFPFFTPATDMSGIRKAYEPHDLYNSHPRVSSCTKGYRNTYNSVNMKHYENDKQPGQTVFLLIPASSPGHKGPATRAIF